MVLYPTCSNYKTNKFILESTKSDKPRDYVLYFDTLKHSVGYDIYYYLYLKDGISSIFLSPRKHFFPHLNRLLNVKVPGFKKPTKK